MLERGVQVMWFLCFLPVCSSAFIAYFSTLNKKQAIDCGDDLRFLGRGGLVAGAGFEPTTSGL